MISITREEELEAIQGKWIRKYAWLPVIVDSHGKWIWFEPYEERVEGWGDGGWSGLIIHYSYRYGKDLDTPTPKV